MSLLAALGLPADQILDALLKREALGSTGTGGGIAIPHARLRGVSKPFGLLVRLARAIDFDAMDGRPVDIVCLLLLPTDFARGAAQGAGMCSANFARGGGYSKYPFHFDVGAQLRRPRPFKANGKSGGLENR